ncbi:isocitrate lyase/PEP mutase family protein [Nocardia farcinica]|uniref:isocitrate lyase/PEP mutase family protein n=1 Tax=Nocardia farcinica TaxID=37329 RepID=UPI002455BEFE|nr:isocitrate lyase/PEP mutase family protein [Nocardia farcinica]
MTLRAQLDKGQVVAGGVYDALSAAVVAEAGYPALALSGAGVAAASAGLPDLGLLSFAELLTTARTVIATTGAPVIVDADTGYGNELNTIRTCGELAAAGAGAVMIEDQTFPKRCGHLTGHQVITRVEFGAKLRAAGHGLDGSGALLIARTDSLSSDSADEAIARCHLARDAGADITFVEAPPSIEIIDRIANEVPGHKMFNLATGGRSPALSFAELAERGFDLVVVPGLTLMPALRAMKDAAAAVLTAQSDQPLTHYRMSPQSIFETVGLEHWLDVEKQYSVQD